MAWYKEWFGEEYLELYAHRNAGEAEKHVDFVTSLFDDASPRAVLDLACGAGRHTEALRQRGYCAMGIDLSITLLTHPPHTPAVAGNMCCLPFASGGFDWVLNFFTSFGYFERERENFRVLEEIVRVLAPGGRFLIDFLNRDRVLAELKTRETQQHGNQRAHIERWYDAATRRINKRIRLESAAGPARVYLESVRAYSQEEVTIGLRWAGLEVDQLFGSFEGETFDRNSPRLILIGHKSA